MIVKGVNIHKDGTWDIYVLGQTVGKKSASLGDLPDTVDHTNILTIVETIDSKNICNGNGDREYLELRKAQKGLFTDNKGNKTNFVDKRIHFETEKGTIRHIQCTGLVDKVRKGETPRCAKCIQYRATLRTMKARSLQV